jgi:hypothetical protein
MPLFDYMRQVQRFVRDSTQMYVDPEDIRDYVNRARRELAGRTQCIRVLTPIAGAVTQIQVNSGGSGYTNPTVSISLPDAPDGSAAFPLGAQASATAVVIGGAIVSINVTFGGYGYFQPVVTITDPTGTGATATALTSPINVTANGQEVYAFNNIDLSRFPGVGPIIAVKSVSILYANQRYSLSIYSFSTYQAKIRLYPYQYYYVPTVGAQYGQGANGSFYMYPVASQPYQMEWDCFCYPQDLLDDNSVEAVPLPWTDAVPWGATSYAFAELQNLNAAEYYSKKFDDYIAKYSLIARPGRASNIYGRW